MRPSPVPRRRLLAAVSTAAILALAPAASAGDGPSTISLAYSEAHPAAPTAARLQIVYRAPSDPSGKPSPITHLVIHAPDGTHFATRAVPACTATDTRIQTQGRSACPADSQVGAGTLTVDEGVGAPVDPIVMDGVIFNSGTGLIETFTAHGTSEPVIAIDRIAISGSTLTGNPPSYPGGPPDFRTAVREIDFVFPAATRFITTPPTCPRSRAWTTAAAFTFADGTVQTAHAATPCTATRTAAAAPTGSGGAAAPSGAPAATADLPRRLPRTGWTPPAAAGALLVAARALRSITRPA